MIEEITNIKKIKKIKKAIIFDNEELKIINNVDFLYNSNNKLFNILHTLNSYFNDVEFSIYVKINYKDGCLELCDICSDEDFFIPLQTVTGASVVNDETIPSVFNCVIHKHPNNIKNFSVADKEFINLNNKCSVLWTSKDGFVNGIVNSVCEYGRIQLPLKFVNVFNIYEGKLDIKKIVRYKEKQYNKIDNNSIDLFKHYEQYI